MTNPAASEGGAGSPVGTAPRTRKQSGDLPMAHLIKAQAGVAVVDAGHPSTDANPGLGSRRMQGQDRTVQD